MKKALKVTLCIGLYGYMLYCAYTSGKRIGEMLVDLLRKE